MQIGIYIYSMIAGYMPLCNCWISYIVCTELSLLFCLHSAAGPHTIVDGKEVVNFASANYLGLIGNEKIIVRYKLIVRNYATANLLFFYDI